MIRPCYNDEGVKVEISYWNDKGYCEIGLNCNKNCPFYFDKSQEKLSKKAFALEFGICLKCNKLIEECICKKNFLKRRSINGKFKND